MSKVLIYEKLNNISGSGFKKVRSDDGFIRLSGVFAQTAVKNRNNRTYTTENYSKMIDNLKKRIIEEGCPGELEHPTTMNIDYNNVSHMVESVEIDKNGTVTGTIKLLDTPKGKIAQALVEGGLPLFISSRATGNVDKNGIVTLEELKTYDLVGTPGFAQARLHCNESMVTESIDDDMFIVYENDNNQNKEENTMEINETLQQDLANLKEQHEELQKKYDDLYEKFGSMVDELRKVRNSVRTASLDEEQFNQLTEKLDNSISREDIDQMISEASDNIVEKLANGIEKWILEEYSPEIENWITEEYSPEIEKWIVEEYSPEIEKWILEEYSPEIENWITEEYSPEIEKWIVEEYSPEVENWLNEEFTPETIKSMLNESIKESKQDKLESIDAILEMLDTDKASVKPIVENKTDEPYFVAAMPDHIRPLWESASNEMKSHIIAKAHMFTLNTDDKIRYFWENKVDFNKQIEPSKNINEGLDTITDQFEKNLRMALRR